MKRFFSTLMSIVLVCVTAFSTLLFDQNATTAYAASDYPAQLVRISTYDNSRNINISGYSENSTINTWITNGSQNENWRFDYATSGVFRIVNMGTGQVLATENASTSSGTSCVIQGNTNSSTQYWYVSAVSTDALGNNYYYKITNYADSTKALTYNSSSNTVTISTYTGASNQKFLLNTAGVDGFAAYGTDMDGNKKASDIGGLLGETVYVDTYDELSAAVSDNTPRTVVITANITYSKGYNTDSSSRKYPKYTINVGDNKTIIGSYSANTLTNVYIRTNSGYGDNVILRNLTVSHSSDYNCYNLFEFTDGENIWLDHITFTGHSSVSSTDIDKFIATKGVSDYMTISDCEFGLHEYGILLGYPADTDDTLATYKGQPCVTLSRNYFHDVVTRAPGLMRYGYFHSYNNYVVNFDLGYTMHTAATIYTDYNYYDGGTGTGSVVNDNALGLTDITNATVSLVGPWYTDNSSVAVNCYKSNNLSNIYSLSTSWRPSTNYSYSAMAASSAPSYCKSYAGSQSSASAMRYYDFASTGVPSSTYIVAGSTTTTTTSSVAASAVDTTAVYKIQNVNSGLYLDVANGTAASGTNVQQWGSTSGTSYAWQTWTFKYAGSGYYYIISQLGDGSTYYLDVTNNLNADGTNIGIYTNTSCDAQLFKFSKNSDGSYKIYTKASSDTKCVEVKDGSTTSGANVQQWTMNGYNCQDWILSQVS